MTYRPEIDGLRALAIVPVLIHHAKLPFLGGGFLGVDVFFVISGYLITGIIADDIEKQRFSLGQFYERRARRILPALFLVCVASSIAAWIFMLPAALADYGDSLVAVLFFSSNFYFWLDRGYFHPDVDEYPLLHTWSLAVEEQFYLLFPLLMLAAWRLGPRALALLLGLGCLLSLGLAEWASRYAPVANFYLAPSRAWELGLGALLGLYHHRRNLVGQLAGTWTRQGLALLGLLLVLIPMERYTDQTPHPSLMTLAPVAGTVLLLQSANTNTWVGRLLAMPVFVGLGLISYSLYLWHQPLLAFLRTTQLHEPSGGQVLAVMVLSIILAYFSWRYVEQPIRNRKKTSVRSLALLCSLSLGALLLYASALSFGNGFPNRARFADPLLSFDAGHEVGKSWSLVDSYQRKPGAVRVAVVGNSHAKDFFNMLAHSEASKRQNIQFVPIITNPICEQRRGLSAAQRAHCRQMLAEHLPKPNGFDGIVMAPDWSLPGIASAQRLAQELAPHQLPILVVETAPKFRDLLATLQKSVHLGFGLESALQGARQAEQRFKANRINRRLQASLSGANMHFLSRRALACVDTGCEFFAPSGELAYYDDSHLTLAGAGYFGARLDDTPAYQAFLSQLKTQLKRPATTADSIPFP